jgi:hypothetical protein
LHTLTDPAVREALERMRIQLVDYSAI